MKLTNKKVIKFFDTYKNDKSLMYYKEELEKDDFNEFAIWGIEYMLQRAYIHNTGEDFSKIKELNINNSINNIILTEIKEILDISTLDTRNNDGLDFQEYHCGLIEDAILKILEY